MIDMITVDTFGDWRTGRIATVVYPDHPFAYFRASCLIRGMVPHMFNGDSWLRDARKRK